MTKNSQKILAAHLIAVMLAISQTEVAFASNQPQSGESFLKKLDYAIEDASSIFGNINENIKAIKDNLAKSGEKINMLKTQSNLIDLQILESNKKMLALRKQIAENKNSILVLNQESMDKELESAELKKILEQHLQALYWQYRLSTTPKH